MTPCQPVIHRPPCIPLVLVKQYQTEKAGPMSSILPLNLIEMTKILPQWGALLFPIARCCWSEADDTNRKKERRRERGANVRGVCWPDPRGANLSDFYWQLVIVALLLRTPTSRWKCVIIDSFQAFEIRSWNSSVKYRAETRINGRDRCYRQYHHVIIGDKPITVV